MNWWEVISFVLSGSAISVFVTLRATRRKATAEAQEIELRNDKEVLEQWQTYIGEPLKKEINKLRKDVRNLNKAISKISDCPHAADCPVRHELQSSDSTDLN